MQLEHATIPPYLTALYSLKPGSNLDAQHILRVVVVEEMLHLTLAANILNAIGGQPDLTAPGFVPRYPAYLPDGETDFTVGVAAFSKATLGTFLKIESPAHAPEGSAPVIGHKRRSGLGSTADGRRFATIGEFYRDIEFTIASLREELGPSLFCGDADRQVTPEYYYSGGGMLFPVTDFDSVRRAIELIVGQGEGITHAVFDSQGEMAHYYRFDQLNQGRYYQRGDTPGKPTGPALKVDWSAVYPIGTDLKLADYRAFPEVQRAATAFNESYGKFLAVLTAAYNGRPRLLLEAVPMMFRFRDQFLQLVHHPLAGGQNACPTFEIGPVEEIP
jgi:hypothetical protein